ncbi:MULTISPECIES: hypothetical protein [unclassified Rathayibacter]|uniref:hypothetical protein n=1 Tax=unclassified Rathayibacter TaxID=2609250 RepID=UPI000CE8391B|nr:MULTISPECIES: hypothetical protein [unclassified Rathayibacter]PPF24077.1 hypothetical protein C5C54_16890 [Rathayibacter sp. AY1F2]PPG60969.1 hypothetical protein C5C57_02475 [Rathayibacter sp. AY1C5]PPH21498.1 hypothetical protein C5C99_06145 [Rathayibacter sp. AY1C4]PPH41480.1 hypothetical protein C5C42_16505 [Rathayibacter sp. AY1F7]PPH80221.1 hypothetical protein C5C50_11095 [Rathayibacter sp. AY1D9]
MNSATIGLTGVIIGAVTSLVASVVVPWIRDELDRRRSTRERTAAERRQWLMAALSALVEYRQASGSRAAAAADPGAPGAAQARFSNALNELTVRLTPDEQPILDVLMAIFAMVQQPRRGIENMVGEAMSVLTLWARGDVETSAVIREVEQRAGVTFSEDRRGVTPTASPSSS